MPETSRYTPLADQNQKLDLLDHVNDDHLPELLTIAQSYGAPDAQGARLLDIFQEGCLLQVQLPGQAEPQPLFVPFVLQGDLEENVLYLAYDAMVRQGKPLDGGKKQFLSVVGSEKVSANMLRLHLRSAVALPENAPGYAWCFSFKTLAQLPARQPEPAQRLSPPMQWLNRLFMWWLRQISSQRREQILLSFSKDQRYYTMRRASRSSEQAAFADHAWVDVYLHDMRPGTPSPGSRWASSLKAGDVVLSKFEYHEHTDALHEGQAVLMGDETALPTIAAVLEQWRNPLAPVVVSITADAADQAYLPESLLPPGTQLHRISASADVAAEVLALLQALPRIDAAWGALENDDAKAVRQWLRQHHGLQGRHNRVKGYWRKTPAA